MMKERGAVRDEESAGTASQTFPPFQRHIWAEVARQSFQNTKSLLVVATSISILDPKKNAQRYFLSGYQRVG